MFSNKFGLLKHPGYNGIGDAVSIGSSIAGGLFGSDASEDAADAQGASAQAAIAELQKIGARTRKDNNVYRNMGAGSAGKLSYLLGVGPQNYNEYSGMSLVERGPNGEIQPNALLYSTDPVYKEAYNKLAHRVMPGGKNFSEGFAYNVDNTDGYAETFLRNTLGANFTADKGTEAGGYGGLLSKFSLDDLNNDVVYNKGLEFGLNEGNKAIERNATRFGNLDSGATLKALSRFANDYGETKAAGAQQRFMGDKAFTLSALLGGTGVGQNAVNTDAQTGAQMAQAIGNAQMGAGNAEAAGIMGGANAWSDALSGVSDMFGGGSRGKTWSGRTPPYVPEYAGGGVNLSKYFA